jgi:predicted NBD/HSP70 family sugar kinase
MAELRNSIQAVHPPLSRTAGVAGLREQNTRTFLRLLLEAPNGLTQRELRLRTELAQGTISNLVGRCAPVLDTARVQHVQGPPATAWRVKPEAAYGVGIDLGRNHVAVVICDLDGSAITASHKLRRKALDDRERTIKLVAMLVKGCVKTTERCKRIAAVTVALPGPVSADGLQDVRYPEWSSGLRQQVVDLWRPGPAPTSLYIENDANVRAFAESSRGAAIGASDVAVVKWSTGVGVGLVLAGEVWRGSSGFAGELGHVRARVDAAELKALDLVGKHRSACPVCQQIDCVDVLAGGAALARSFGADEDDVMAVLAAASNERDPRHSEALAALRAAARIIGRALGPTLMVLDLDKVVVGGFLGHNAFELVAEDLRAGLAEASPMAATGDAGGRLLARSGHDLVTRAAHGPRHGALGAAWHALDHAKLAFLAQDVAQNERVQAKAVAVC